MKTLFSVEVFLCHDEKRGGMKTSVALIILIVIAGCLGGQNNINETDNLKGGSMVENTNPTAVVTTNKGEFRFELYRERAPVTVQNFIDLAESGFYDGLTFHRYEPGFVIQGGDPRGDGTGGSEKNIPLEIHPELTHVAGAVGMARSQDPNSASSQFYVTLAPSHFLDGNYAVFGKVTQGMDVVLSLRAGDSMSVVRIEP